jgi:hypothetical protein
MQGTRYFNKRTCSEEYRTLSFVVASDAKALPKAKLIRCSRRSSSVTITFLVSSSTRSSSESAFATSKNCFRSAISLLQHISMFDSPYYRVLVPADCLTTIVRQHVSRDHISRQSFIAHAPLRGTPGSFWRRTGARAPQTNSRPFPRGKAKKRRNRWKANLPSYVLHNVPWRIFKPLRLYRRSALVVPSSGSVATATAR